jgi:hypothetical protein
MQSAIPASRLSDGAHWRERAAAMRILAAEVTDEQARHTMFRITGDYERLAVRAEQRARRAQRSR